MPIYNINSSAWNGINNLIGGCSDTKLTFATAQYYSLHISTTQYYNIGYTDTIYVKNFGFDVPNNATITGVKVSINRKASDNRIGEPNAMYVRDEEVYLATGSTYSPTTVYFSDNEVDITTITGNTSLPIQVISPNYAKSTIWPLTTTIEDYGSQTDLWSSNLTSNIINSDEFGVLFKVRLYNSKHPMQNQPISVSAFLYGIRICVYYSISHNFFDENITFNDESFQFGNMSELIYSKVNPTTNVLKIKNTEQDRSIYPMIDEYGYSYTSRFIFKSTWDSEFYLMTQNNTEQ